MWNRCELIEDPATPGDVTEPIERVLRDSQPDDAVLLYFAGHAEMPRRGDQYTDLELVMRRSKRDGRSHFLELHKLYDLLRDHPSHLKAVVLDCCNSGRVPALGDDDAEVTQAAARVPDWAGYVLTALHRNDPSQSAHATSNAFGPDYTAFSGALVNLFEDGVPDGPDVFDFQYVREVLRERLWLQDHPLPGLVETTGSGRFPILENAATVRIDEQARARLAALPLTELAEQWAAPEDTERHALNRVINDLFRDNSAHTRDFVHALHCTCPHDSHVQGRVLDKIRSAPVGTRAQTTALLLAEECGDCAVAGGELLENAARTSGTELADVRRAWGESAELTIDDVLVRCAPPQDLAELTRRFLADPRSDSDTAAAFTLLEAFGTQRSAEDVRTLLALLHDAERTPEADAVLDGAALGRDPADAARLAAHIAGSAPDTARTVDHRVARRRRPRELAAYAAARGDVDRAEEVLTAVSADRSLGTLVRLAAALHSQGMHAAGRAAAQAAMARDDTAAAPATVLDTLGGGDAEWRRDVVGDVRDHVSEHLPAAELAAFFRWRGHRLDLLDAAVTARSAAAVARFYRDALDAGADDLAELIASRAAALSSDSGELMTFVRDGEVDGRGPAEVVFGQLHHRRDGDTLGNMLVLWTQKANRPARLRKDEDALLGRVADDASANTLARTASLLAGKMQPDLAQRLLRRALEHPQRFSPQEIAALLVPLSVARQRRVFSHAAKPGIELLRRLYALYQRQDEKITIGYFAELVVVVRANPDIAADLREEIIGETDTFIADERIEVNQQEYVGWLREFGAAEHADRFLNRVAL
nr:caspase family protein [Saccharopolyspora sp. HNM0983]